MIQSSLYLFLMMVTGTFSAPLDINRYDISAELPFYYRLCLNGSKYLFTKDHYLDLTSQDQWVPSASTHKVPLSCSQFVGGSTACFLSEIKRKYFSLINLREDLRIHNLFSYITTHCASASS